MARIARQRNANEVTYVRPIRPNPGPRRCQPGLAPTGRRPIVSAGELQPGTDPAGFRSTGPRRRPAGAAPDLELLPFWATAKSLQGSTINARVESMATKPALRSALKGRRCLAPMAGYYEWSVNPNDKKKDPWFIHADRPLRAAGLWEDASKLLDDDNLGSQASR